MKQSPLITESWMKPGEEFETVSPAAENACTRI